MTDYTPTTAIVREQYILSQERVSATPEFLIPTRDHIRGGEFDRFVASVRNAALDEAAEVADVLMSDGLREKPGMGRDYALNEADAILARFNVTERDEWEYGASWLEGDERVFMPTENDWRARVEVQRMNQDYDFPAENYVVRRHPASEWEAFDE